MGVKFTFESWVDFLLALRLLKIHFNEAGMEDLTLVNAGDLKLRRD